MLLGDFTMPLHPPGASSWSDTLDMDIERLATLDELGYHETWLGEHPQCNIGQIYKLITNASVQTGPSANTERVMGLVEGTWVKVSEKVPDRDWYRVARDCRPTGYIYAPLLKPIWP